MGQVESDVAGNVQVTLPHQAYDTGGLHRACCDAVNWLGYAASRV